MNQATYSEAKPVAIITKNNRGGWSMIVPEAMRSIGNYDTPEKAAQIALINGYQPDIEK